MMLELLLPVACAIASPRFDATETAEETYYRAFHAEVALRDFDQAESLYAKAATAARDAKQLDLQAKSLVGRGRCLVALGKRDEAKKCFDQALELEPSLADARAELARLLVPNETSKRIVDRIDQLLEELSGDTARAALSDFARMGDVAVPTLAARVHDEDVTWDPLESTCRHASLSIL